MNPFEKLALELKRLQTGYREESYYRYLCDFLESYAGGKEYLHMLNVAATNNPSSESVGEGIGFPDIEIRQNRRLIGYIEVKSPNQNLDSPTFSMQFNKYKESLENIIFTNFKKWVLYTWDKDGKPQKTEEAEWDYQIDQNAEKLKRLLTVFFEGQSYQAKTPHQLAIALARKTKLLSQQVEEALISANPDKKLIDLKKTFEKTLIQDIDDHQFANIYAETIAYSLFLAKLEHYEKGSNEDFSLRTAIDFLPKSVPIFRDLYQLTGGRVEPITPGIYKATEILIEQLNFADIERIYKKLVDHKAGEDPVIQFYEPFLSQYDPEERKARGVYYTPKPVVDYIVRSVDFILKTKFNKQKGLGDKSVQILDPATGTGTFLMSVIQNIYSDIEKENKPLGDDLVKRKFNEVVSNHILKHLYGFELLVAPYAIAHLKLTLELERLGFKFSMTEDDSDKDNDRLNIFLANTLDDPEKPPISLFGFESITEESEKAQDVKRNSPILSIIGNPPYSGISTNKGKWITNLIEDYKYVDGKHFGERKHWLQDDYVKFIRFSEWKINKTGVGIVALITNRSYLDNPTFRGMRQHLMNSFDEIYILDLNGSEINKELGLNAEDDENVFNIQQGVTISIFVKINLSKKNGCKVFNFNLRGERKSKFNFLIENNFTNIKYQSIIPKKPYYFFVPQKDEFLEDYVENWKVNDIFPENVTGIVTMGDEFIISDTKEKLSGKLQEFLNTNIDEIALKSKFNLGKNYAEWVLTTKPEITFIEDKITEISYRPFDTRWTYFDNKLIWRWRKKIMHNFLVGENLGLITSRINRQASLGYFFVSHNITDFHILDNARDSTSVFTLYIYEKSASQLSLLGVGERIRSRANISPKFIKEFSKKIGLQFVESGQGDLDKTFGPEDIFYYAYAVFHSPTYRIRYAEQLKIDFPRLPLTSSKELFNKLVEKGNELVNLHLLGENPFDKSKTVFDDTSKWGIKIAGEKPENLEDWKVMEVRYDERTKRVYVNSGQYFDGIEKDVWEFMVGGYQVLDKWLKDRRKAGIILSYDDQIHYMKIVVSLRETIRIMKEIDEVIPSWPMK